MGISDYNHFARDYHSKRRNPWRPLKIFIDHLKKKGNSFHGVSLDLGCANGRNFTLIGDSPKRIIGIDISLELLKIARRNLMDTNQILKKEKNSYQILLGDIKNLPIRPRSISNIFSIATIHHIQNKSERAKLNFHLLDILEKKGNVILTVWRKWQKKYRYYFMADWLKRKISRKYREEQAAIGLQEFGDKHVSWTVSRENKIHQRFYHFFSKNEIKNTLKGFKIEEFKTMGGPTNRDNFFIHACKGID